MSQPSSVSKPTSSKCKTFAKEKVKLPSGLTLLMSLEEPTGTSPTEREGNRLAILLHPWSWLGGSMSDPVLHLLNHTLKSKGVYTLRYNSRGVGGSSGWRSFTGLQEGTDLQEVVQWALSYIEDVRHVLLVGYSYGSLIAAQHPVLPSPIKTSHILLSYPLDKRSLLTFFHSNAHVEALKSLIQSDRSNVLIICGDHDEFTTSESYKTWVDELRGYGGTSGKLETHLVHGGTHFWRENDADELQDKVEAWLDGQGVTTERLGSSKHFIHGGTQFWREIDVSTCLQDKGKEWLLSRMLDATNIHLEEYNHENPSSQY